MDEEKRQNESSNYFITNVRCQSKLFPLIKCEEPRSDTRLMWSASWLWKYSFMGTQPYPPATSTLWLHSSVVIHRDLQPLMLRILTDRSFTKFSKPCSRLVQENLCRVSSSAFLNQTWASHLSSEAVFLSINCEFIETKTIIEFFWESFDIVNVNILCKLYRNIQTLCSQHLKAIKPTLFY